MIYYTGDIHGQKVEVVRLAEKHNLTREDIIVILGDAGLNYYNHLRAGKPTILMVG